MNQDTINAALNRLRAIAAGMLEACPQATSVRVYAPHGEISSPLNRGGELRWEVSGVKYPEASAHDGDVMRLFWEIQDRMMNLILQDVAEGAILEVTLEWGGGRDRELFYSAPTPSTPLGVPE